MRTFILLIAMLAVSGAHAVAPVQIGWPKAVGAPGVSRYAGAKPKGGVQAAGILERRIDALTDLSAKELTALNRVIESLLGGDLRSLEALLRNYDRNPYAFNHVARALGNVLGADGFQVYYNVSDEVFFPAEAGDEWKKVGYLYIQSSTDNAYMALTTDPRRPTFSNARADAADVFRVIAGAILSSASKTR